VNLYTIGPDAYPIICIALAISSRFLTGYRIFVRIVPRISVITIKARKEERGCIAFLVARKYRVINRA